MATTPMFAPDGSVRMVPSDQIDSATQSGGELAQKVKAPDGSVRYVRQSQFGAALKAGGVPYTGLPSPNPAGLANQALAGTGIQVSPMKAPNVPVIGDNPVVRAAVAAGATLPNGSEQPILGQGKSPIQVLSQQPLPAGTPSGAMTMISEPAQRIGSGDVAGGIGDIAGKVAQAYILKKATESIQQSATPAGADLLKQAAGQRFAKVQQTAQGSPVAVTNDLSNALSRYQELVDAGGSRSLTVSKLLQRLTDPTAGPLSYAEARDFYSNLTRLSANDYNRLTPKMQAQVGEVTRQLGRSIQDTATSVGEGGTYADAMKQRRQASTYENTQKTVGNYAVQLMKYGVPASIAGYIAKNLIQSSK